MSVNNEISPNGNKAIRIIKKRTIEGLTPENERFVNHTLLDLNFCLELPEGQDTATELYDAIRNRLAVFERQWGLGCKNK